ncbi:MAG TPA: hypothetical protein H9821_10285 [Candidatus Rothia avicola]|uniref:Uncharacterized protein n=1 Tax=Candidatus Rothia avicola TaxID=2840478 RepID=A0A9D1ZUH5_9MICC|nr:hypothetical protein [Candidatus Rothia avicola]
MSSERTEIPELPYGGAIRALGLAAGVLMLVGTVCGVIMLLLKWATGQAPNFLSIAPLLTLPLAFLALLGALFLTLIRRRAS